MTVESSAAAAGGRRPGRGSGVVTYLLIAATLVLAPALSAEEGDREAELHLRVLAFDRGLKARAGGRVVIGVLFAADTKESSRVAGEMQAAFGRLGQRLQVQGLAVSVVSFPFERETPKRLKSAGVAALYVAPGLEEATGALVQLSRWLQVPALCRSRAQVKAGLTVGVVDKDGAPSILVNLPSARAAGMDLSGDLFKVAEVIK